MFGAPPPYEGAAARELEGPPAWRDGDVPDDGRDVAEGPLPLPLAVRVQLAMEMAVGPHAVPQAEVRVSG